MLVDAIKAKPTEDTRSGCGSKHHLAVGGGVEEVVTQGGETKRTLRSLRDWEKVSHHYRHSVVHFGHSVSQSACTGLGRLVGDTLPLLPSIHLYPIHLTPADKRFFSCSNFFFCLPGGSQSCPRHQSSLSPPFPPVQSYWLWPKALGCPLLHSGPSGPITA